MSGTQRLHCLSICLLAADAARVLPAASGRYGPQGWVSQTHAEHMCDELLQCCADSAVCRMAMPNIDWSDIATSNLSTIDVNDFRTAGAVRFFAQFES